MNFVVDIGNSNTVIGLFKENIITKKMEDYAQTDLKRLTIWHQKIHSLMSFAEINVSDISECIISSVVPTWNHAWERFSIEFLNIQPEFRIFKDGLRDNS